MSDPKTSDMSQEDPLLEEDYEDIFDNSQEDAGHSKVVDDSPLEYFYPSWNTVRRRNLRARWIIYQTLGINMSMLYITDFTNI